MTLTLLGCIIVTSIVCAVLAESSINIDISISDEAESNVGRNTTSTVIKTQDTLATGAECDKRNVSVGSELGFGVARDNVISVSGNLSWSEDNIANIDCVTEFVMMYREADNVTSPATVLCPGYKVISQDNEYWCEYNLDSSQCGNRLYLMLESWSDDRMLQPSTVVTVDCEVETNVNTDITDNDEDSSWQLPLVLASLRVFSDAATGQGGNTTGDLGCSWSQWGQWSPCSLTCGGQGVVSRTRAQAGSRVCQDTQTESKECQTNLCPVDCEMSAWSVWSPCSTTCGTGTRSRHRNVTREPQNWGAACPTNLLEQQPCLENECAVDGGWSEWSRWGYCSVSCDSGLRSRSRSCTNPAPQFGGEDCVGVKLESKECYLKVCPSVDGGWSAWSRWTVCSKSCGWGEQRRTRTCSQPMPQNGGRECSGDRFQNNKCMLRRCPWAKKDAMLDEEEDSTVEVTTEIATTSKPKPRLKCPTPPFVFGFLNPQVDNLRVVNMTVIFPGTRIVYRCSKGYVLDTLTNQRTFELVCGHNGSYSGPQQWSTNQNTSFLYNQSRWPRCMPPTHCVGPAKQPLVEHQIYLPVPRRDARVNTRVKYQCKQNPNMVVNAGCFYDGVYRYDQDWPMCSSSSSSSSSSGSSLDLCSAAETSDTQNSNIVIAMPVLSETSHGWLSSPNYPQLHNKSASCSYTLRAPPGYILAIGVEDVRSSNNSTSLEVKEPGVFFNYPKIISSRDIRTSHLTLGNAVTIKSLPNISHAWRISYLVVIPN